jgi:hypothetical protein
MQHQGLQLHLNYCGLFVQARAPAGKEDADAPEGLTAASRETIHG